VRDALPLFSERGLVAAPAWAPEAIGLAAVAIAPIVAFAHAGRASKSVPSSSALALPRRRGRGLPRSSRPAQARTTRRPRRSAFDPRSNGRPASAAGR
jgi:hypothetical protein